MEAQSSAEKAYRVVPVAQYLFRVGLDPHLGKPERRAFEEDLPQGLEKTALSYPAGRDGRGRHRGRDKKGDYDLCSALPDGAQATVTTNGSCCRDGPCLAAGASRMTSDHHHSAGVPAQQVEGEPPPCTCVMADLPDAPTHTDTQPTNHIEASEAEIRPREWTRSAADTRLHPW